MIRTFNLLASLVWHCWTCAPDERIFLTEWSSLSLPSSLPLPPPPPAPALSRHISSRILGITGSYFNCSISDTEIKTVLLLFQNYSYICSYHTLPIPISFCLPIRLALIFYKVIIKTKDSFRHQLRRTGQPNLWTSCLQLEEPWDFWLDSIISGVEILYFSIKFILKLDRGSIRSSPRNGIGPISNKNMGFWKVS